MWLEVLSVSIAESWEEISNSGYAQAIELNVSCPNVKLGGLTFGADPKVLANLIKKSKKRYLQFRCLSNYLRMSLIFKI